MTSSQTGFRFSPRGAVFDSGANGLFTTDAPMLKYTLAFLNTKLVIEFVKCINPTINTGSGTVGKLPLCYIAGKSERVSLLAYTCINISKGDWDSYETSWDFKKHPLI